MSTTQNFVAASPDAMIIADELGTILQWNSAAVRMFGLPADEAVGRSLDVIVPEPMRGAHTSGMQRLTSGGVPRVRS